MISLSHAAWAILNSIWQGAVVAGIAWMALRLARRASAAVRYYVWAAVLVAALVLPVINLLVPQRTIMIAPTATKQPQDVSNSAKAAKASAPVRVAADNALARPEPAAVGHAVKVTPPMQAIAEVRQTPDPPFTALAVARADLSRAISDVDLPAIAAGQWLQARIALAFGLWLAIATLLFARLGWGLYRLSSIKRGLVRLDDPAVDAMRRSMSRPVTVAESDEVGSPCVIGYAHPVVALPSSLVRTLEQADLHRVLAHELGHVRRFDDWANLVQQCIRAVLFFNPIVHAACRALDVNREIACDDLVAAGHADRIEYAKCLTEIARRGAYVEHLVPAAGFFPDRRQIVVRIEQLLDRDHAGSARVGVVPAASGIALIIAVAALAAHQLPALAISTPSAPSAPKGTVQPAALAPIPASSLSLAASAISRAAAAPVPPLASVAVDLDKARSAEARALYEATLKEPALAPSDVAAFARGQAMLAAVRGQLTHVGAHAFDAVLARAPRIAVQMAQARIAQAPRIAMVAVQMQAALAPKAPPAPSSEDDFLSALDYAGYTHLSVDDLIAIRNSGVTGSYLRALKQYGVLPMQPKTLIALADSGVNASTIASMYAAGYRALSADDLIALQNAGVSAQLVVAAKSSGRATPTIKDLVALANAGVSSDYITTLAKNGYSKTSVASLIALANAGVSSSYLGDLANEGYAGIGIDSIIALANAGVSPSYIRGLADLGYSNISSSDLIRLADAGVTPKMIKTLRAHGFSDKLSVDELIKLANNGF